MECDDNSEVIDLELWNLGLSGTLPTQIGLLTSLTILELQGNLLSGTIPTQLIQLTKLTTCSLTNTQVPSLSSSSNSNSFKCPLPKGPSVCVKDLTCDP